MDRENDDVVTDFDQTNGQAPGLEGDSGGWDDANGDGVLEGDEVNIANPFAALTGDDTLEEDDTEEDDDETAFGLGSDDAPGSDSPTS